MTEHEPVSLEAMVVDEDNDPLQLTGVYIDVAECTGEDCDRDSHVAAVVYGMNTRQAARVVAVVLNALMEAIEDDDDNDYGDEDDDDDLE